MEKIKILTTKISNKNHENTWQSELGLSRLDQDEELMKDIIILLESALIDRLKELRKNISKKDYKNLSKLTHSQLPSLKILGFDHEAKVFEAFESAVFMADEKTCERLTPMIQSIWYKTIESLAEYQKELVR